MKTHGFRSVAYLLSVGFFLGISPQASTQQTADPPAAGESTDSRVQSIFQDVQDVHVVNVDVIVTDREGHPVSGLTADDFELYENGERIDVDNFYSVEGGEATALEGTVTGLEAPGSTRPPVSASPESDEGRDRLEAEAIQEEQPSRPLYLVVYVDNVQLHKPHRDRALAHLREVLEDHTVRRDTQVMLVSNDRGIHFRHGFTSDRQTMFQALEDLREAPTYGFLAEQELRIMVQRLDELNSDAGNSAIGDLKTGGNAASGVLGFDPSPDPTTGEPGPSMAGTPQDYQDSAATEARTMVPQMISFAQKRQDNLRSTLGILRSFIDHVSGLPGRKAVLYVSGGMSLNPAEALFDAYDRRVSGMRLVGHNADVGREIRRYDMSRELTELVEHANAGGVTFYAIDASPPASLGRGDASSSGGGTGAVAARFSSQIQNIEERNQHESMELVAEGTGGRAALSSSNLDEALESFFTDFENFYSLGYVAENDPPDRTRAIEVRLTREARNRLGKKVELRYRNQVRDKTVAEKMAERTLSALMLDVHDNPLGVELEAKEQTAVDDGQYAVPVLIRVPLGKLVLLPGERQHQAKVNIYVAVLDEKGRTSPVGRQACPIRVPNEELLVALGQDAGCGVRLLMREGHQRIAVGVRDELAAVSSTVYLDLDVPGEPESASLGAEEGAASR